MSILPLVGIGQNQEVDRAQKLFIQNGIIYESWISSNTISIGKGLSGSDPNSHPENIPLADRTVDSVTVPINETGRYIRIYNRRIQQLSLAEVRVYDNSGTSLITSSASASQLNTATGGAAAKAIDGNTNGDFSNGAGSVSVTASNPTTEPWWEVDLGSSQAIDEIVIHRRNDGVIEYTESNAIYVVVSQNPFQTNINGVVDDLTFRELLTAGDNGTYTLHSPPRSATSMAPLGSVWTNINLTHPAWYTEPHMDRQFLIDNPTANFSTAKIPFHNQDPPATGNLLTYTELDHYSDRLTKIGLGDEEGYSTEHVERTKKWISRLNQDYPNAIVHTNQGPPLSESRLGHAWSTAQLEHYTQTAKPDLLSFDDYYFGGNQNRPGFRLSGDSPFETNAPIQVGGSLKYTYESLQIYRDVALKGLTGDGSQPVAYGQYMPGYRLDTKWASTNVGEYIVSESQIYGVGMSSLTMGAKWLSIFRYLFGQGTYGQHSLFHNADGSVNHSSYYHYAKLGRFIKNLSPHLSRLISTDVRIIPGEHMANSTVTANPKPANIPLWASSNDPDPYIFNISAANQVANTNNGLRGDVLIGYFKPVKNLDTDSDVTMSPVNNINSQYFMIMNGLTKPNEQGLSTSDTIAGKAINAKQIITLDIDFGSNLVDDLYRVNPITGIAEQVMLMQQNGSVYKLNIELDGGMADLFYWENAHNVTPSTTPTNVALGKTATQSSDYLTYEASKAVDGNTDGDLNNGSVSHTDNSGEKWWEVDLGELYFIDDIKIWNRTDCCSDRLSNYYVFFNDAPFTTNTIAQLKTEQGVTYYHRTTKPNPSTSLPVGGKARYVRIQVTGANGNLSLAEVQVFATNIARNKTATQSSDYLIYDASRAVDGNTDGDFSHGSVSHTNNGGEKWWEVDLGGISFIDDVKIWNRTGCCSDRLSDYYVFFNHIPFTGNTIAELKTESGVTYFHRTTEPDPSISLQVGGNARYIRIQVTGVNGNLNLAEVEVFRDMSTTTKLSSSIKVSENSIINKEENIDDLQIIYPNPVSQHLHVKNDLKVVTAQIFNLSGNMQLQKSSINEKSFIIDVQNLSKGVYILTITDEIGKDKSIKFIKE